MKRFDVCNGDADGLCAVLQWRLVHPAPATLVTGLKRELSLLAQVPAQAGDELLVCDLSMQRNLPALERLLAQGVAVRYVDHHKVDRIPLHPGLQATIAAIGEDTFDLEIAPGVVTRWMKMAIRDRVPAQTDDAGDEGAFGALDEASPANPLRIETDADRLAKD